MPASKGRPETGKFARGIRHPSQSSGLRFPFDLMISFRAAGGNPAAVGGTDPFSPPFSPQRSPPCSPPCSVLPSVLCHRCSHPQLRVAGGSPGWQVAGLFHSALNAALHSVLRDRFSHLSSIQPSIQPHSYVVTRSRPYPKAFTTPILDTPYSILSSPLPLWASK